MKNFFKVFAVAFLCFSVLLGGGVYAFDKYYHETSYREVKIALPVKSDKNEDEKTVVEKKKEKEMAELEEKYGKKNRINVLMAGMEDARTDALILFSFNLKDKKLDMISVPRDTYYDRYGYKQLARKKINSVYGYGNGKGEIEGTMKAVSEVLGVPVHDYIMVDYKAVSEVVDSIGGVDVDIPFNMNYDDKYADPPLHIHFKKGPAHLDGQDAIRFLRWRKNNTGLNTGGDVDRIRRQQEFIQLALQKAINPTKLPGVINVAFKNTKTSLDLKEALYYGSVAIGMSKDNINSYTIPGEDKYVTGAWYFYGDEDKTEELMKALYKGQKPEYILKEERLAKEKEEKKSNEKVTASEEKKKKSSN